MAATGSALEHTAVDGTAPGALAVALYGEGGAGARERAAGVGLRGWYLILSSPGVELGRFSDAAAREGREGE